MAMGCTEFVAVGGAGALVRSLALGDVVVVVVTDALRDEGTSFHYLPPARVVDADPVVTRAVERTLEADGLPFRGGRTWTLDAIFRSTRRLVERRVGEDCIVVEMEAASLMAVAKFRGVRLAQVLHAGGTLAADAWDERDWTGARAVRERLFDVALKSVASVPLCSPE